MTKLRLPEYLPQINILVPGVEGISVSIEYELNEPKLAKNIQQIALRHSGSIKAASLRYILVECKYHVMKLQINWRTFDVTATLLFKSLNDFICFCVSVIHFVFIFPFWNMICIYLFMETNHERLIQCKVYFDRKFKICNFINFFKKYIQKILF